MAQSDPRKSRTEFNKLQKRLRRNVGQAIEDELSEFDATEVYLVTAETGPEADQAVLRLADRVVPPLRPIHVSSPGDRNGVD